MKTAKIQKKTLELMFIRTRLKKQQRLWLKHTQLKDVLNKFIFKLICLHKTFLKRDLSKRGSFSMASPEICRLGSVFEIQCYFTLFAFQITRDYLFTHKSFSASHVLMTASVLTFDSSHEILKVDLQMIANDQNFTFL